MKMRTRWLIILAITIALLTFSTAPAAFAKKGGRGERGGGLGRDRASAPGHSASATPDRGSRAETASSDVDGDVSSNEGTEAPDEVEGARERRGPRSGHGHRHGQRGEISEADVIERAEYRSERMFDHLDANEDGIIDADEVAAASEEKAQAIYDRLADRFGVTDEGIEIDPDSRLADRLGAAAADGVITLDELSTELADGLNAFDQDGDGIITADELSDGMVEKASEHFDERDTNDDGVINADDRITEDADEADAEDTTESI